MICWGVEREDYATIERRRKLEQSQPRLNYWPLIGAGLAITFGILGWAVVIRVAAWLLGLL